MNIHTVPCKFAIIGRNIPNLTKLHCDSCTTYRSRRWTIEIGIWVLSGAVANKRLDSYLWMYNALAKTHSDSYLFCGCTTNVLMTLSIAIKLCLIFSRSRFCLAPLNLSLNWRIWPWWLQLGHAFLLNLQWFIEIWDPFFPEHDLRFSHIALGWNKEGK